MRADPLDTTDSDLSFQHYKVLRQPDGTPWELGRGSMGITYKAFDVNLCCEVALKVINAATLEHPHARDRFVSEARAAAKLRHRNIASVYHLGNDGAHYFYAMEFVDGETLDALVRRQGPQSVATVLRILLQAARALAAASRQGLVHRDLKPANIMITHEDDDDDLLVKVIDFGLAKPINSADGTRPLTFGGFVGTPQFASPEQLEERRVDGRSDIYSLGATAWFLLTGRAPFLGSLAAICRQHLTQSPPWSQLPKPFPETVRTLLGHMLAKDPVRRPADAVDLRRQIEASLEIIREPQTGAMSAGRKPPAKPSWFRSQRERSAATRPPSDGEPPRTGMILKGRYELLRLVGEGNSGRVFLARDRGADEAFVAVKVLHAELVGASADLDRLGEEVRLIQAAEHPQLIRLASMESLPSQGTAFLVEEWLHGFTVLEFLAVRGGALPIAEGLRLIEQAAAAADHAESRRLERLDFALHQFHLHFPAPGVRADDPDAARQPMQAPMAQWPAWVLKLNPLGALRNGLESSTWAGDVTLVPGAAPTVGGGSTAGKSSPALRELYTRGVAQLTYELLGGAPASPVFGAERRGKYASLPVLNEEANALLQRALHEKSAFASGTEFYRALARATGHNPTQVPLIAVARQGAKPGHLVPAARVAPAVVPGVPAAKSRDADADEAVAPSEAPTLLAVAKSALSRTRPWTEATFGADGEAAQGRPMPWSGEDEEEAPGTVWDRLALVSGEGASSRLWMGGVAACFLGLLLGSVAFLKAIEHHPGRNASGAAAASVKKTYRPPLSPLNPRGPASPVHRAAGAPVASAAAASAKDPAAAPGASLSPPLPPGPDIASGSAGSSPPAPTLPNASVPNVAATPPVLPETPPAIASHAPSIRVHVDSKPAGADVLMRGRLLGTTPFDANLPAGDYQLIARYKNWPEIHQSLHLDENQPAAATEVHLMPPGLVPFANVAATPAATPNRARRAQQDAIMRRNFVQSTRSTDAASGNYPATPSANHNSPLPALHPFDPNGVFRSPAPLQGGD